MLHFGRPYNGINYFIEKWKQIGLLEGCKDPIILVLAYEKLSLLYYEGYDSDMITRIFPILYRLINDRNMTFDTIELKRLIEKFKEDFNNFGVLDYSSNIDVEAEFCRFFTERYIK